MIRLTLAVIICLACGCSTSKVEFIIDFPGISMRRGTAEKGAKLKRYRSIRAKWCEGDIRHGGENVDQLGFVDQVLYKAHSNSDADYILDARFYWIEEDCILLKGYAARLESNMGTKKVQ